MRGLFMKENKMGARDRYTINVKCEDCKNYGSLDVSENDGYAFMRGDVGFAVDKIEGEFSVSYKDKKDLAVVCKKCNKKLA